MARAKPSAQDFNAFRTSLAGARGYTARSSLYRWLRAHYDEFLAEWSEGADWPAFVQAFADLGLTDRTGKPAAAETARKTWMQVRRDVAKARVRKLAERAPPLAPGEIAPGVRLARPPGSDETPAHIELEIRPAKPRLVPLATEPTPPSSSQPRASASETPSAQMSSPLPEEATDEEVEARLRTLHDHMTANKVPIPKPLKP